MSFVSFSEQTTIIIVYLILLDYLTERGNVYYAVGTGFVNTFHVSSHP
jgi:hypothetical protein